jgi:hypothetical protein
MLWYYDAMPKRKSVEAAETAPVVVEVKKTARKAATKPTAAAAHKHHSKKNAEPVVEAIVVNAPKLITQEAIAQLAYSYWEARGRQGGSPEQDWLRAEEELSKLA